MTPEQLAAIRDRWKRASHGEWVVGHIGLDLQERMSQGPPRTLVHFFADAVADRTYYAGVQEDEAALLAELDATYERQARLLALLLKVAFLEPRYWEGVPAAYAEVMPLVEAARREVDAYPPEEGA